MHRFVLEHILHLTLPDQGIIIQKCGVGLCVDSVGMDVCICPVDEKGKQGAREEGGAHCSTLYCSVIKSQVGGRHYVVSLFQ